MENIRRAVERAKGPRIEGGRTLPLQPGTGVGAVEPSVNRVGFPFRQVGLDAAYLQANRVIAHGVTNPLSRPFDMLRTQVTQAMEEKGSKILAITSPTPGCGKTLIAANLALSIARHPEKSILLVDLDLRKPRVATSFGLPSRPGLLDVLDGTMRLNDAISEACIGNQRMLVLPTDPTHGSSDIMASRIMAGLFQDLRREFVNTTIIVDLPPILASDDVIAVLPQIDCILLVTAVGVTKVADIDESSKHLRSTDVVRVVVNKTAEPTSSYYYY